MTARGNDFDALRLVAALMVVGGHGAVLLGVVLVGRELAGLVGDVAASRAAARVGTALRRRLVGALVDRDLGVVE